MVSLKYNLLSDDTYLTCGTDIRMDEANPARCLLGLVWRGGAIGVYKALAG